MTNIAVTLAAAGALAASVLLLAAAPGASPSEQRAMAGEKLLRQLASRTTQGWVHDDWSYPKLERRLGSGKRLFITCGTVAVLAQRLLADQGVDSRVVVTMTRRPFNADDNGHTLLEVRTDHDWVLYDLNSNRVAVNDHGRPIDLAEQLAAGDERRWRVLAEDRWLNPRDPRSGERIKGTPERQLDKWHDRVLGVPMVETAPGSGRFVFNETSQRARLEAYSPFYDWIDDATWQNYIGT